MTAAQWEQQFDPDTREYHMLPVDDSLIHARWGIDCNCTPCVSEQEASDGGQVTVISHHALDGRPGPGAVQDDPETLFLFNKLTLSLVLGVSAALGALAGRLTRR